MPVITVKFDEHVLVRNVEVKLMIDAIDTLLVNDTITVNFNQLCFESQFCFRIFLSWFLSLKSNACLS